MPDVTDMDLAREFAASNSEPAFAELVRRHVNLVYSVAFRYVRNAQDAQDVTQAVFIILAQKAAGLRERAVLTGWLYETTRFTALRFLRTNTRRQFREQEAYMQPTPDESDTENVWRQLAPLLEEAMTRLNEKERTLLALRFFENRTGAETAALLGIEEWAGRKRVNRALEKLRKFFTKRGVALSTTAIAGAVSVNSVQAVPVGLAKTISVIAITKGAVAGGSTLALVKGALKLMAWSKMKIAIVVGAGVLLAAGTTTVTVKEIKSSRDNAIFERIWAQPDSRTMDALIHAPPALIVRPTHYPARPGSGFWTDARVGHGFLVNASVKELVGAAYASAPWRTVLPANMPSGGFDLMETLPPSQNEPALQREIKKRFGLVGHKEMREAEVFRLEVNDPAKLNMRVSAGGQPSAYGTGAANNTMNYVFKNQTLNDVASHLESYFSRPVMEPNGLTGHYDLTFQVNYKLQREALQQSFRYQLVRFGLELVPDHALVEMLVVQMAK